MDQIDERTDDELLLAAADDAEAFGIFYRRHMEAMVVFFRRRTGNAEVAADLAMEVFAAALQGSHRFRPERAPALAWLYGIANKKLADSARRGVVEAKARASMRLGTVVLVDEDIERIEELSALPHASAVLHLVNELPADQGAAIRARIVEEREYAEIASQLQCSEAVVRKRVSRGLKWLRAELEEVS